MNSYIKMNKNDNHLSYGNLNKLIKDFSKNKNSALQTEIFCTIFNIENINDTTVNNYCIGIRSINSNYKQIYLNYKKKYSKNNMILLDIILNISYIIDGIVIKFNEDNKKLHYINNNIILKDLCNKLYNISKNDLSINKDFINKIKNEFNNNDLYNFMCSILFFVILEKKQPLYENDLKVELIQNILNTTDISINDLENYLKLKFTEGINYYPTIKKMALDGNSYAAYELGMNEYKGITAGYPRYNMCLDYFKIAADNKHPSACYMIAKLYINKIIESNNKDLKNAYEYLITAINNGNVASINLLGLMHLNGIYPVKKDIDKAKKYFVDASKYDYSYAYNNLGKIEEDNNNYESAFKYYLKSANLGESYGCNKVAEYYRKNSECELSYEYFNKAIDNEITNTCYYAYYNLAKYFYSNNSSKYKNLEKAYEFYEIASSYDNFESMIELLYIYSDKYLKSRDKLILEKLNKIIIKIETHFKYNLNISKIINENLNKIKNKPNIINISE